MNDNKGYMSINPCNIVFCFASIPTVDIKYVSLLAVSMNLNAERLLKGIGMVKQLHALLIDGPGLMGWRGRNFEVFSPALRNLKMLDLEYNEIENLPSFASLKNLRELLLSNNEIRGIDEELNVLIKLTYLDLSHNELVYLPSFGSLNNLNKLLPLDDRFWDIVQPGICTKLTFLDLSSNEIKVISSIITLKNLRELRLANNKISKIEGLGKLTKLAYLDLSNNLLSDITILSKLTKLVELKLTFNNGVTNIGSLNTLGALKQVNLIGCIGIINKSSLLTLKFLKTAGTKIILSMDMVVRLYALNKYKNVIVGNIGQFCQQVGMHVTLI